MENKSQTIVLSLKYVLLAILTGVLVGIIDTVFGRGLLTISDFRTGHYLYLIPFLPFAGLLITWLYYHFSETSLKGMTLVFETGQKKREDIPLLLIPLVMSGTWITHLFGGSAGREGVAVQIGAVLSHVLGRRFHLPKDSRVMLITGMAAGFGGLFQTPLTAVFFSMEVIVAGKIQYEALLPALIASYTAAYTSHTLGLEKLYVPLKDTLEISDAGMAVRLIVLGIIFGLTGRLFSFLLAKSKKFFGEKIKNPYFSRRKAAANSSSGMTIDPSAVSATIITTIGLTRLALTAASPMIRPPTIPIAFPSAPGTRTPASRISSKASSSKTSSVTLEKGTPSLASAKDSKRFVGNICV